MDVVLDYASGESAKALRPGAGYVVLVTLNLLGLALSLILFVTEVSGDVYAPLLAMFAGGPLILAQVLLGSAPAWVYVGKFHGRMPKWPVRALFALSILPVVVGGTGLVLALVLPHTHGSTC